DVVVLEEKDDKFDWLSENLPRILDEAQEEDGQVLIFVNQKSGASELAVAVREFMSLPCEALHGDSDQNERMKIMADFRSRKTKVLVATDVASRGLDIPSVKEVICYDMSNTLTTHTHRLGRTGRAGHTGHATTLLVKKDNSAKMAAELVEYMEKSKQEVSSALMDFALEFPPFAAARELGQRAAKSLRRAAVAGGPQQRHGLGYSEGRGTSLSSGVGKKFVSSHSQEDTTKKAVVIGGNVDLNACDDDDIYAPGVKRAFGDRNVATRTIEMVAEGKVTISAAGNPNGINTTVSSTAGFEFFSDPSNFLGTGRAKQLPEFNEALKLAEVGKWQQARVLIQRCHDVFSPARMEAETALCDMLAGIAQWHEGYLISAAQSFTNANSVNTLGEAFSQLALRGAVASRAEAGLKDGVPVALAEVKDHSFDAPLVQQCKEAHSMLVEKDDAALKLCEAIPNQEIKTTYVARALVTKGVNFEVEGNAVMAEAMFKAAVEEISSASVIPDKLIRMRDISEFGAVVSYSDLLKMWEKREGEGERAWKGYVDRIGQDRADKLDALHPGALDLFIPPPPSVAELLQATAI
ncbi:hypothetical protein FOZ62_010884, partial [Perkinsus olseni]